jgi:outer membrane protein insertion porin family
MLRLINIMRFSPVFAAFLLVLASLAAVAQPPGPLVREVEVQYAGPPTVSKERILANMRTTVGKPYSEQAVEEDIRSLYSTGNVTNVRIFGEPVRDGVKVIVVVQTKATVGEVQIQGVTQLKVRGLEKQLSVKKGELLNEANLEQDRQKILEAYQNKGYTDTRVEYKVTMDDTTNRARILYSVSESGKTIIHTVRFEGNSAVKDKELRKVMKTKPHNMLSFITKAGRLQNDVLDQDITALRDLYQNKGYVDVQIGSPRTEPYKRDGVDLIIPIVEGAQYQVGTVELSGANVFTNDELRKELKTVEGAIFSPKSLRDDVKSIQDKYGARGYIDLQANASTSSGGPQRINVAFRVEEGSQSYVEHVNVSGNTKTKDKVIRRELAVAPGDVYNTVLVDASKARLSNLNYFERVETYPSDTLVPGRKDLNVLVQEKRTGSFNFGAGFSSIDSLIGFAEIQQSNFDVLGWPTFTGGGQRFRTRVQYGTKRKDFIIGLTEPWFMDYQLAVGGELFYNEASFVSTVYSQRNYGFDINARKGLGRFTSARLEYRLENITIFDVDEGVSQMIKDEEGSRTKSSVTAGLTFDTRDSIFLTRKGQRVDLTGFVAGGPLGGDTEIYGFDLTGSQYFHLFGDTILLFNGEVATVDTWGGGDRVPIFDRLFLGGANSLRGFKYRDVGPKDENGDAIGGKSMARLTVEYTFPVVERIRGAVFYDVGFVNGGSYEFSPDEVNSDIGLGVRLDLPIGPVRIDYGIPLQSDRFNDSSGKFNFNIGYQF